MATATANRPPKRVRIPTHYPTEGSASVKDAMQFLNIKRTRLWKLTKTKVIPSEAEGGKRLYDWADLWAYRNQRKASG